MDSSPDIEYPWCMAFDIDIDIGFASLAGRKDTNEDFCAAMLPEAGQAHMGSIVAIADGVSTGGMGREAAQTTVTSLVRDYYGTPETWDTTVALDRIIAAQNTWLAGINRRRHPILGLTTLTAVVLRGQSYTVAHVGDSRCYLLRDGKLVQITHDHVVNHPDFKHQLLRSVGAEDHVVVDYVQGELQVGDVLVLLTDGVHGAIRQARIQELASLPQAKDASRQLVDLAIASGSLDNASAMVVRVLGLLEASLADANLAAQTLPIAPRLKIGDVLDGLTITALVADTGVNLIYQARHPATQALYAIKTLQPGRAHDAQERNLLAHEGWLSRRMQALGVAKHLVTLHEALPHTPPRSAFYLLYDWHSGETLQQMLDRRHKFSVQQALTIATHAVWTLARLHRQCVIHRDVKPANLHLGDDGVLRLLDLGVALSGRESDEALRSLHAGTPSFVNPEQWGYSAVVADGPKEPADEQSDLFATGVTLYQLLTHKLPYGEVLPYQVGRFYRDPTPPSRHNPEVPIWLDHIVLKAVARDKRRRFETAEEMMLSLERGALRPLTAPQATPLIQRDPLAAWKLGLGLSVLFNLLLVYWIVFLPK
jgi:serine/threonine protein phosphatase PrpC